MGGQVQEREVIVGPGFIQGHVLGPQCSVGPLYKFWADRADPGEAQG